MNQAARFHAALLGQRAQRLLQRRRLVRLRRIETRRQRFELQRDVVTTPLLFCHGGIVFRDLRQKRPRLRNEFIEFLRTRFQKFDHLQQPRAPRARLRGERVVPQSRVAQPRFEARREFVRPTGA